MQTSLADFIRDTPEGREAEQILRTCVHCGFCLATCPTYHLLGDELDSPRGRIYLIKQVLEGTQATAKTQTHLDRCMTCRNCETTCPSGVQYGRLVDIGRKVVNEQVRRPLHQRAIRWGLRKVLPNPIIFTPMLRTGQLLRPLLPGFIKRQVPPRQTDDGWPATNHARRMLVLEGCVQPAFAPRINGATARVLDRLDISLVRAQGEGCCGALSFHLDAQEEAKDAMRRNIDAWWPHIEAGAEAIVMTASGCGATVKEYGHILRDDPVYADKAARAAALTRDLSEILGQEDLGPLKASGHDHKVAFHPPCTLQHGQQLQGVVERILAGLGFNLTPVPDAHLCCGSAGTYSITQPRLSEQTLENKLRNLQSGEPELIVTANIGCLLHLQAGGARVPVQHWIELLDPLARAE
jgi:glycolate oxidase iron-sulfur subunit